MSPTTPVRPQITVLDTGGQYTHLITRKVRELGIYADILPSSTPAPQLATRNGIILSGGPSSVYEPGSPQVDPTIFDLGIPILGICYGLQLMAHHLGGHVIPGDKGEYGPATLHLQPSGLFAGLQPAEPVWMSHRDTVGRLPDSFQLLGSTDTCHVAAAADPHRRLFGVQFHPEVVHTPSGQLLLRNFLFDICACQTDWNPADRVDPVLAQIRESVGDRNVLFFVSGGVDSTVAFTLCLKALGDDRVRGYYVDTGLMRADETDYVSDLFASLGTTHFAAIDAGDEFLTRLENVTDPETKRRIIGEHFVEVQNRILEQDGLLSQDWVLGQGTIYPDTIESGGTAQADLIKTHHNRVAGIQALMEQGRIVEPLALFYKDEVREIGTQLGLPSEFLHRHPFPGPGLAIRCLGSKISATPQPFAGGWLLPVHSVGVQGDSRTYRPVLALDDATHEQAAQKINEFREFNRVVTILRSRQPVGDLQTRPASLTADRLARLRAADRIVRDFTHSHAIDADVWQFPVILIPLGSPDAPDSIVLRPVTSVDGMTARSARLPKMDELAALVLAVNGVCAVLLDLTHKPPGTIEWE